MPPQCAIQLLVQIPPQGLSAVICEIGAQASHAVIVSRELGVPCVVSLAGASTSLPSGTLVELDGSTGTVKVIESV